MADLDEPVAVKPRRGTVALLIVLGAILLALLGLWLARKPIAADLIDRELARRGVPAHYQVKRIGLRTQRLEGVVIGDPASPDLTADWVEVDLRPTFGTPAVRAIRAAGVRLRGRLVNGRLSLGAVDKLLPAPSGKPFQLPDLPIGLRDARLALAMPAGDVTLRLDGQGNLANGFAGHYVAVTPALELAGCRLTGTRSSGMVTTQAGRPHFTGPAGAERLACKGGGAEALAVNLDATLAPGLDGWRGAASFASRGAKAGEWTATGTRGQVDFAGNAARTSGVVRLAGLNVSGPQGHAPRVELGGRYLVETGRTERLDEAATAPATSLRFEGTASAQGTALATVPRLDGFVRSAVGTPFEPIAQALAQFAGAAGRTSDLRASLSVAVGGGAGSIRVGGAELNGGGARLTFAGGEGVRLVWPGTGQPQVDGRLVLSGQGVPQIVADIRQSAPGAPISGLARMEPFVAGNTRVDVAPVRFEGGRFSTVVEASGPLAGGRVEAASLPIKGRIGSGGFVLNPECAPLTFRSLIVSGLRVAPARLRLCPVGPGLLANGRFAGSIEVPRLRGMLGSSPVTLAAQRARFDGAGFRIARLAVRLGAGDQMSRLDIVDLTGASVLSGLSGRFAGASGQIGRVPLIGSDGVGRWAFARRVLTVSGALTVADSVDPARFNPLVSRNLALRLKDNALTASGDLLEPQTATPVAHVDLRHNLGAGTGSADIDVAMLRFDRGLQPERITRLTLGVVADVNGTLSGQGRIVWDATSVASTGLFHMAAESLSAPFGPVTGVKGDIRFTDLLGLVTAPDQSLTVATVNPGILVEDGVVRYRIVPGLKVAVDSARWPFAGGELTLRPTELDFSQEAARRLTFDIAGLDAAKFINKLEFKNLSATGIFDGNLPMVFDQDGGRIVDGALTSRAGGGTLSYVGEVSNANLGIWGGIAFDALKSIAYKNMTIRLNGKLDGEMVSLIRFAGVSRGTIQPVATGLIARVGGQLAKKLQQLPFVFNIQIRAPFRGLISSARSYYDPTQLIEDQLGPGFQAEKPPIQPSASRKMP